MKKGYFATGMVMTGLLIWGAFNPLEYINAFEVLVVEGPMAGQEGFVGLFLVWAALMAHVSIVGAFLKNVIKRVKEVM